MKHEAFRPIGRCFSSSTPDAVIGWKSRFGCSSHRLLRSLVWAWPGPPGRFTLRREGGGTPGYAGNDRGRRWTQDPGARVLFLGCQMNEFLGTQLHVLGDWNGLDASLSALHSNVDGFCSRPDLPGTLVNPASSRLVSCGQAQFFLTGGIIAASAPRILVGPSWSKQRRVRRTEETYLRWCQRF